MGHRSGSLVWQVKERYDSLLGVQNMLIKLQVCQKIIFIAGIRIDLT